MVKIKVATFSPHHLMGKKMPTPTTNPVTPSPCHLLSLSKNRQKKQGWEVKEGADEFEEELAGDDRKLHLAEISLEDTNLETSALSFPEEFCVGCWALGVTCHCKRHLAGARSSGIPDVFLEVFKAKPTLLHFSSFFSSQI